MNAAPLFHDIDKRIALDKADSDLAYFLALTLKLEYLTKVVTAGVLACVGDDANRHRYSIEHGLIRANSIGEWVRALNDLLVGPAANFFYQDAKDVIKDLTERVGPGDWRHSAVIALRDAANEVGAKNKLGTKVSLRQFFEIGAQLRNRSRGHGAPTTEQCSRSGPYLAEALHTVAERLLLFKLPWAYLHQNLSGKYRMSPLAGDTSCYDYLKRITDERFLNAVYLYLERPLRISLVFSDSELRDITLPNGNYNNNKFETLSYVTNDVERKDGTEWSSPPGQLPSSETEGDSVLEPFGNTFANVPPILRDYVPRPELVNILSEELIENERHHIVSLTGPGGIGKTTIAIAALHAIAGNKHLPYEVILWISARDIDLLESGAKSVNPKVINQDDISHAAVELLGPKESSSSGFNATKYFENCLTKGAAGNTLFVIDNFETVRSPADTFTWIDTYIRPPNKVLITTRIRDFRGDYPIEIGGMNEEQANKLVDQHANRLGVNNLITKKYKQELISESHGHPYVIRIMLGQIAEEGQIVTPKRIMASSDHILRALFERTYNALTFGGKKVFLLLSSWKVLVPEVAVEAVLLRPGIERFNVSEALDQLHRFSLVERIDAEEENQALVGVPLAAAIYGRMKLETSRLKAQIETDRIHLMEFGHGRLKDSQQQILPRIENLYKSVANQAQTRPEIFEEKKDVLEFLAERVPKAFLQLSDLIWEIGNSEESAKMSKYYIKRFIEVAAAPDKYEAWLKLADRCSTSQDPIGEIHAISEAALLSTSNIEDLSILVSRLNNRIHIHRGSLIDIREPEGSLRELISQVIRAMERHMSKLDATDCSRLAWLLLNVGNVERARDIANRGLQQERDNEHCQKLIQRLDS